MWSKFIKWVGPVNKIKKFLFGRAKNLFKNFENNLNKKGKLAISLKIP